jgi:site-specific DNA-methyltransferase (adenine-specific)
VGVAAPEPLVEAAVERPPAGWAGVRIIQGDAIEVMRRLPAASIDAIITDPPYCSGAVSETARTAAKGQGRRRGGIAFQWFVGDNMGTAGLTFLLRAVGFESLRLLKTSGSLLLFCDWRMAPNLIPAVESAGLRYQNLLVWDKEYMGLGTGFRMQHELILHFTTGSPCYHHFGTGNVLRARRVQTDARLHQTEKPVELIERLICVVCPLGGTVLDPFGGSGTTAVAAANSGRDAICIERDRAHVETAERRIMTEVQLRLAI